MASNICIFEDDRCTQFLPLTYFRPVYNLRCGITSLKEKIIRAYPKARVSLHCRSYLQDYMRLRNPGIYVNEVQGDQCLFVNGRVLADPSLSKVIPLNPKGDALFVHDSQVVAASVSLAQLNKIRAKLNSLLTISDFEGLPKVEVDVKMVSYPWNVVHENGVWLKKDYEVILSSWKGKKVKGTVHKGVHLVGKDIIVHEGASVKPGVVIDSGDGPVIIDKQAKVFPQATIMGPAYIGEGSWVKVGAQIYENTTIGPVCKVGGEIEESIIHGYSNKQHAGFLGHSYIGSWVNLGADTNNSDLKNNYGTVKVYVGAEQIDTGLQFVGLTMGDHSKSAINSMFNTGTVVGVCSNIFGFGFPPKYVPSFSWGAAGETFTTFSMEKAIGVARRVMARRKIEMTDVEERLFKNIFEQTSEDRKRRGMPL